MAIPLVIGGIAFLGLGYFTVSAVATLVHWITVSTALVVGLGVFYRLVDNDQLEFIGFESEYFETLTAGVVASVTGFVLFRVLQAVFAALGMAAAFVAALLIATSFLLGPGLVLQFVGGTLSFISDIVGGE